MEETSSSSQKGEKRTKNKIIKTKDQWLSIF